jgi:hypothetical protein
MHQSGVCVFPDAGSRVLRHCFSILIRLTFWNASIFDSTWSLARAELLSCKQARRIVINQLVQLPSADLYLS